MEEGGRTLKGAVDSAFAVWAADFGETMFAIGSVVGPDPFPSMVRDFQSIVGREAREQILEKEGRLPDALVACVGGGSIASGLDYPGVGPQHAHLKDIGRVEYITASDAQTIEAFKALCRTEGIIPAIESAHAVAGAMRLAPELGEDGVIVVNLSGRGDKDIDFVAEYIGMTVPGQS